jgi:type VI protein secretion system component Hcp
VENVAFSFKKIRVAYTQQAPTGGAGSVSEFGWDVAAGHA